MKEADCGFMVYNTHSMYQTTLLCHHELTLPRDAGVRGAEEQGRKTEKERRKKRTYKKKKNKKTKRQWKRGQRDSRVNIIHHCTGVLLEPADRLKKEREKERNGGCGLAQER